MKIKKDRKLKKQIRAYEKSMNKSAKKIEVYTKIINLLEKRGGKDAES